MIVELTVSDNVVEMGVTTDALSFGVESPIVVQAVTIPVYEGAYELTPTAEQQTIPVHGYRFEQDLVIDPIPSNYGLISWDGSTLTVS